MSETNVVELNPEALETKVVIESPKDPPQTKKAKKGGSAKVEEIRKEKKALGGKTSKRKEAKLKKALKQTKERVAKHRAKQPKKTEPRKPGPAMKLWAKKFRSERKVGECFIKSCKTKPVGLAKFCQSHKKQIRKDQLKANNVIWRKRVKDGEAGHHVVYDGRATQWAAKDKVAAKRIVSEGKSIIPTVKEFDAILAKTNAETKVKEKRAGKSKAA